VGGGGRKKSRAGAVGRRKDFRDPVRNFRSLGVNAKPAETVKSGHNTLPGVVAPGQGGIQKERATRGEQKKILFGTRRSCGTVLGARQLIIGERQILWHEPKVS